MVTKKHFCKKKKIFSVNINYTYSISFLSKTLDIKYTGVFYVQPKPKLLSVITCKDLLKKIKYKFMHNQILFDCYDKSNSSWDQVLLSATSKYNIDEQPIQIAEKQFIHVKKYIGYFKGGNILANNNYLDIIKNHKYSSKIEADLFSDEKNLEKITSQIEDRYTAYKNCMKFYNNTAHCYDFLSFRIINKTEIIVDVCDIISNY
jgi:hypothetical protein